MDQPGSGAETCSDQQGAEGQTLQRRLHVREAPAPAQPALVHPGPQSWLTLCWPETSRASPELCFL